jgi:hypothetical protein
VGSRLVTQFIGNIPRSKTAPHRHLYDEALFVLSEEGMMWTDEKGMRIVGVIYAGDDPNIDY